MKKTCCKTIITFFITMLFSLLTIKSSNAKTIGSSTDKVTAGLHTNIINGQNLITVSPNSSFKYSAQNEENSHLYMSDLESFLSENKLTISSIQDSNGTEKNEEEILATGDILVDSNGKKMTLVLYGDGDSDGSICMSGDINIIIDNYVYSKEVSDISKTAIDIYVDENLNVFDINRMKNKYLNNDNLLGNTLVSELPEDEDNDNDDDDKQEIEYKMSTHLQNTTITIGGTTTITTTITPATADQTVIYTSSDTKIATVDATGKITGISEGTAVITVKSEKYDMSYDLTINVEEQVIHVTNLEVEVEPFDATGILAGKSVQATATISPSNATNKNVTWSSSNESVATVDQTGRITAISAGTAQISVTADDGGISARVTINVTSDIIITNIKMTAVNGIYVGASTTPVIEITPTNATNQKLSWSSSDESVATVDETGTITGVSAGTAIITVKTTDGSDITITKSITVYNYPTDTDDSGGTVVPGT